ncbi:hypothetical protein EOPP23_03525 [Endozoicomonas sp. OPT23]|uniref:OmpP1/FadL family transporter n=1 Tax=Endozoicomonas sp. OPT23 TaxID=2072845 RepID=UPI00129B6882|nr:outer membrane protein transport protein [Endozoicomonas sp. OPT23]MRI32070.1 hypothetical protein [Endozoicomonas sp. OPT23]
MSPLKNRSLFSTVTITLCGLLTASVSSISYGAGYGINENSGSYMGTGFAGRASNPQDASILASNPAGMGFMDARSLSAGSAFILKGGKFSGDFKSAFLQEPLSGSTSDFQKNTFVPFGHIVVPLHEHINLGFSGYAPFGIELEYDKGWVGQYFGLKTSVQVVNLQASISYRIMEQLSAGVGIIGSYVKGELTQKTFFPDPKSFPPIITLPARVEGDDKALSWNVGFLWRANEKTYLGLAYHDQLKFTLEGDSKAGSLKHKAKLDITMPEKVALSMTHHIDSRLTLMAEATWTRWSRFEQFHVKAGSMLSSYIPMKWKDVWAFSGGISYQLLPEWQLRAGYMRDNSPVDDNNRTVRSPDANRNWYTFGFNWKPVSELSIDLSYAYVDMGKSNLTEQKHESTPPHGVIPTYGTLNGEYNNHSHIIAAQLNYTF